MIIRYLVVIYCVILCTFKLIIIIMDFTKADSVLRTWQRNIYCSYSVFRNLSEWCRISNYFNSKYIFIRYEILNWIRNGNTLVLMEKNAAIIFITNIKWNNMKHVLKWVSELSFFSHLIVSILKVWVLNLFLLSIGIFVTMLLHAFTHIWIKPYFT